LLLLLHFAQSQSNGNLLFYSLFPIPRFSVSGLGFSQAANPPIFRKIKYAAKPHLETQIHLLSVAP
jgi:hypothetical protein